MNVEAFIDKIFRPLSPDEFNGHALELFHYQRAENRIYGKYLTNLGIDPRMIDHFNEIPFLPIGFFKSQRVVCGDFEEEAIFSSSGTSGMQASKHFVKDLSLYIKSFKEGFRKHYGEPSNYRILGLLPSYLEREGSSLIFMVNELIQEGNHPESGFFLDEYDTLAEIIKSLSKAEQKAILIGVTYALLDFAKSHSFPVGENITLMETGGMKGRRKEITREELHHTLCEAFRVEKIHAEYGMTELLSQAYSQGDGRFFCPPWMKVLIRDIQDPFAILPGGHTGAINIIDLANIHSCAFIETQDIGRLHPDGSFEVLGRTDTSDIRGCSLLIES